MPHDHKFERTEDRGSSKQVQVSGLYSQLSKSRALTVGEATVSGGIRIYFRHRKAMAFEETQMTKEVLHPYYYDLPALTHCLC